MAKLPGEFDLIARYFKPLAARMPGAVGLDDSKDEKGEGNVIYQVYGDGQLLHTSAPILWDNPGTPLTVDVTDVDELRLVVGTNGVNYRDHANWADAKVTCAG